MIFHIHEAATFAPLISGPVTYFLFMILYEGEGMFYIVCDL